ncbi:P2 family phage contractile tail tube protein [Pseudomonas frederiksbergensis]|jgi:P2 family phage contractile tail tube protein|uniref:Phage tail protein n=1 Tax=Pseudomonas frederiksbergensis TaxID=104087 RepID=A0A2S8HTW1_9PSED|nr:MULTISPECIES: phage major tail tube protein [Pseudomonas]MBD9620170.1 phage major tail tube protein [Pseudomonas sp. PDM07]PQP05983.1 phage tail protein [Pseudomonas frederiksbergensis]QDV97325.1 phage tail protein [Pseudomonas sp. ATCC 43928]UVM31933.1 phage major tail tube protein [Pseudomonas sp. B21-019]UVM37693.1 phage major tail tube protein [Pseudomonas sp. B21-017]
MFTNRVRQAIAATLQGLPLSATVEEFTPPKIEFDMENMVGGRFIVEEMAKSAKALGAKLILQGAGPEVMLALGVKLGDDILLNVREAGQDQDGNTWFTYHTVGGKLKVLEEAIVKMGEKPKTTLELSCRTYNRLENGVPVIDVDVRTQKFVLNGVDILGDARRAVLLP